MTEEQGTTVKMYDLSKIPDYRKPVIEELICGSDIFTDEYDTPENLDAMAVRIFDIIVEQHLLDAHLRENLQTGTPNDGES